MLMKRFVPTLLIIAAALALAGCGNKDGKAAATQVAAKVDSEEITVYQINDVLSRTRTAGATPEEVQGLSREVLEKLIDQQLAVGAATANKLQRTPEIVSRLEAARREILAQAYAQQIAAAVPKPGSAEIRKYHDDHPQLFAQRRVFNVQEVVVPGADKAVAAQLQTFAAGDKSLESATAWLKEKKIKYATGSATRAAEQIPLEMLGQVAGLRDGQSTVFEAPQGVTMVRVVSSQAAPVAEDKALPAVEQYLTNQRAREAVLAAIKQLRADVKITYMGEFANAAAAPSATGAPAGPAAAAPTAGDPAAGKTLIEKGVGGLK